METIRALIQQIQEQSDRQAPPAEILTTVNALQLALQNAVAENAKKIKSGNISVVMPSGNRAANPTPPGYESSEAVGWRIKQKPQPDPEAERFVAASNANALQQPQAPEVPAKGAIASQYQDDPGDEDAVNSATVEYQESPLREPGDWEKKPTPWQEPVRPNKPSQAPQENPIRRTEQTPVAAKWQDQEQPLKWQGGVPNEIPSDPKWKESEEPVKWQPDAPQNIPTGARSQQPEQRFNDAPSDSNFQQPEKWQPAPPQNIPSSNESWKPKDSEEDLHAGYKPFTPKPSTQQEMDLRERNDIFSQSASLNDRHRPEHEEIGSALNDEPVKDLRKAIGINDRFVFLSELFRGDEVMYERSLKTINNFRIYPEAEYWIERELKVKLGWDENKTAVKHFRHLVKRRFQGG